MGFNIGFITVKGNKEESALRKKVHGAKSREIQVQAFNSSLPGESHRLCLNYPKPNA